MSASIIAAITPDIFTPWSSRALTHEFGQEDGLVLYRDGNKTLQLADPVGGIDAAKKFYYKISGADISSLALGGVWVGTEFVVDLANIENYSLPSGTNSVTLDRDPVPNSVTAMTKDGIALAVSSLVGRVVTVAAHVGQTAFVGCRYRLTMWYSAPKRVQFQRAEYVTSNSAEFRER